jgi:hypothetical protein
MEPSESPNDLSLSDVQGLSDAFANMDSSTLRSALIRAAASSSDIEGEESGRFTLPGTEDLSEVISKLDPSTLKAELTRAAASETDVERVQPGDVITAEFMNALLKRIRRLEKRVENLEGKSTGKLTIFSVKPDPLILGKEGRVIGQNFGSPESNTVLVNGEKGSVKSSKSEPNILVFQVPALSGIPDDDTKKYPLRVVNTETGSADTKVRLKNPEPTELRGGLLVTYAGMKEQAKIQPGGSYVFLFDVEAETTLKADYTLDPITDTSWTAEVVDAKGNARSSTLTIPASPSSSPFTNTFGIRLDVPEETAEDTKFTVGLRIAAKSDSTFSNQDTTDLQVAAEPEPPSSDLSITLESTTGDPSGGTVVFKQDAELGSLDFRVSVTNDSLRGSKFDVKREVTGGDWKLRSGETSRETTDVITDSIKPSITLQVPTSQLRVPASGTVTLTVTKAEGDTSISTSKTIDVGVES